MGWFASFPYKWQTLEIACGLTSLVSGAVFFLISVGARSPLWKILGGTFCSIGVLLTLVGVSWCCYAIRTTSADNDMYCRGRDYEAETLTTEGTDLYRG